MLQELGQVCQEGLREDGKSTSWSKCVYVVSAAACLFFIWLMMVAYTCVQYMHISMVQYNMIIGIDLAGQPNSESLCAGGVL